MVEMLLESINQSINILDSVYAEPIYFHLKYINRNLKRTYNE